MSLEQHIQELTAAVRQLTAVMQSGAVPGTVELVAEPAAAGAALPPAEAPKRGRPRKDAAAPAPAPAGADLPQTADQSAAPAAAPASSGILGTVNDSGATRYIHIEKNKTVAAIEPGQTFPSIEGLVEVTAEQYAALRAAYTPSVAQAPAAAPAPAASPAPTTPAASPASSQSPATSPATGGVTGPQVLAKAQELHKAQGNDGLKQVLDHFKAGKVSDIVGNASIHAAAMDFMNALLNPAPAEVNLFG